MTQKVYFGVGDDGRIYVQDPLTGTQAAGRSLPQALDELAVAKGQNHG